MFLQCFSVLFRSVLLPKSHQKPIHPDAEPRVQNSAGCGGRGVEIDGVSIIGVEDATSSTGPTMKKACLDRTFGSLEIVCSSFLFDVALCITTIKIP